MSPDIAPLLSYTKPRHRAGLGIFWETPQRTYHFCWSTRVIFIEESVMNKESTSNEDQQDPLGITDQSGDRDPEQGVGWNEFLTELFKPSRIC